MCAVLVLGDGARWLWKLAGEHFGGGREVVDCYHASEQLWTVARLLESDATNELDLFLATVYRLGYHKLLIYPFRPSVHRSPRARTPR